MDKYTNKKTNKMNKYTNKKPRTNEQYIKNTFRDEQCKLKVRVVAGSNLLVTPN